MSKDTGGAAFPLNTQNSAQAGAFEPHAGMTLRQFYIAHALMGFCANPGLIDTASNGSLAWVAERAVEMADVALLAERSKTGG